MDVEAASFVVDRLDLARQALREAQQVVGKFSQREDDDFRRILDDLLDRVEHLDTLVKAGSYPA